MYRKIIVLLVSTVTFFLTHAQQKKGTNAYSIQAILGNWDSTQVSIISDGETLYTGPVQNGGFQFSSYINNAREGLLVMQTKSMKITFPIFIEPGIIRIQDSSIIEKSSVRARFHISGTPCNDLFSKFYKELSIAYPINFSATQEDSKMYESSKREYIQQYIQTHRESLLTLLLFRQFVLTAKINVEDKITIFNSINKKVKDTYGGKEIATKVQQLVNTSVGKAAPLFTLPDSLNKSITLRQFRGKYVLLDFWASWCGPCRKENPSIKKVYETFKDSNFMIVSVSLDTDKEKWLKAIEQDQLSWVHVSDLKGWQNKVAKQYYIESVPANFLLDPSGVIIAKDLDADAISTKLSSALSSGIRKNK